MKRLLHWYGAGPLNLLALLACFALAGYAAVRLVPSRPLGVLAWFLGAVIGHDLLLVPLYSLADRSVQAVLRHRAPSPPAVAWVNYVRVPAALSGLLLLVWFPLILRLTSAYQASTTLSPAPYLWHWLGVTGALFLLSAVALAFRLRGARAGEIDRVPFGESVPGWAGASRRGDPLEEDTMPDAAGTEFWRELKPIKRVFQTHAMPEAYISKAATDDERYYAPLSETVGSRPLWISPTQNRWCDVLRATSAGLVNRHYHPQQVFAYTISGRWGYLEHDWIATAGDFIYEAPGEAHTLVAYETDEPMLVQFNVTGPLIWLDEEGEPTGHFDVFDYIRLCQEHYDRVGIGADYISKLFR